MTIKGRCLCGTVTYEADDTPTPLSHCHCAMCRKAHGAPFATFTSVATENFRWTSGEDRIVAYASSDDLRRRFCTKCGSALPSDVQSNGRTAIPAGGVTAPLTPDGERHIFVGSKAAFVTIDPEAEQHDAYPQGPGMHEDLAVFDTPVAAPGPEGTLTGSCLCQKVVWRVTPPFRAIFNCHCSRCRHARAAAHATNGFVSSDQLEFVSGADNITVYRVPEAAVFAHAFCKTCGGGTARANSLNGMCSIPLGSMDDTGGAMPQKHIFVASKADWHRIVDDIPQTPEGP